MTTMNEPVHDKGMSLLPDPTSASLLQEHISPVTPVVYQTAPVVAQTGSTPAFSRGPATTDDGLNGNDYLGWMALVVPVVWSSFVSYKWIKREHEEIPMWQKVVVPIAFCLYSLITPPIVYALLTEANRHNDMVNDEGLGVMILAFAFIWAGFYVLTCMIMLHFDPKKF